MAEHLDGLPGTDEALAIDRVEAWLLLAARCVVDRRSDEATTALTTACERWAALLDRHPQRLGWEPARPVWELCQPLLDGLPRASAALLGWEIRRSEARTGRVPLDVVRRLRELLALPAAAEYRFGPPLRRWNRQCVVASDEQGWLILPLPGQDLPRGCALVGLNIAFQGALLDAPQIKLRQRIPDGQPWSRQARGARGLGEPENQLLALRALGQDGLALVVRLSQWPPVGTELTLSVLLAGAEPGVGTASLSGLIEAALTAGPTGAAAIFAGAEAESLRHHRQFGELSRLLTGEAP